MVSVGDTANQAVAALELGRGPVTVARRCPELAGLLAACQSGLAQVAVVAGSTDGLTATLVDRLTAVGVGVVAVAGTPAEAARLSSIGAWPLTGIITADILTESVLGVVNARRHRPSAAFGFPSTSPFAATPGHDVGPRPAGAPPPGRGGSASGGSAGIGLGDPATGPGTDRVNEAPSGRDSGPDEGDFSARSRDSGDGQDANGTVGPPSGRQEARSRAGSQSPAGHVTPGGFAPVLSALAGRTPVLWRGGGRADGKQPGEGRAWTPGRRRGRPARMHAAAGGNAGVDQAKPRTLAVWGPIGSPGRTTVAVNMAAELAAQGHRVMLVDADIYGASVAASLGLLEESASFAQACRVADQGLLSAPELQRICTEVVFAGGTFLLLTGLTRPDRWTELRASAVERVLQAALSLVDRVVIDCGFCLETDEELSYDTVAPRRNAATLAALGQADTIYAVGTADAIGIPRLIRALADLPEACAGTEVNVVLNKVRKRTAGGTPLKALEQAWQRFGPALPISHALPWDADVPARALLEGRLLRELAPNSPLHRAIRDLCCAPVQENHETAVLSTTAMPGNPG